MTSALAALDPTTTGLRHSPAYSHCTSLPLTGSSHDRRCDEDDLPTYVELAMHTYEVLCDAARCNAVGPNYDATYCDPNDEQSTMSHGSLPPPPLPLPPPPPSPLPAPPAHPSLWTYPPV